MIINKYLLINQISALNKLQEVNMPSNKPNQMFGMGNKIYFQYCYDK